MQYISSQFSMNTHLLWVTASKNSSLSNKENLHDKIGWQCVLLRYLTLSHSLIYSFDKFISYFCFFSKKTFSYLGQYIFNSYNRIKINSYKEVINTPVVFFDSP